MSDLELQLGEFPVGEALIVQQLSGADSVLVFRVSNNLLERIQDIDDAPLFGSSPEHQALVLTHLLELGTTTKEAELAGHAGQDELF